MLKKHIINNLSSFLGFVLLGISIVAIHQELRQYNYNEIFNSLVNLPATSLYLSIGFTILSYMGIGCYDTVSFYYLKHPISYKKSIFTGFISEAATNTVGMAFLTGSAIRYRYYSNWGVTALEIAQIIAFENVSFWLGLFAVSGVVFLTHPITIPAQIQLPFLSVQPLGLIFLMLAAAYIAGSIFSKKSLKIREHEFRFPSLKIALMQLGISSLDWVFTGAVLFVLLPETPSLSFFSFLGVFLLAMLVAAVSNVPGGLGVFESIILLLLSDKISPTVIMGTLLAYRAVYYLFPLAVATGLMGAYEIKEKLKKRSP
ncbi:MAG: lysylphosphatidylglycerol synthase domain-containing protein [Coleofasciculaceae cyanobacterium]